MPALSEMDLAPDVLMAALEHVLGHVLDEFEQMAGLRIKPQFIPIEPAGHTGKEAFDFGVRFDNESEQVAAARARLWVPFNYLTEYSAILNRTFALKANDLEIMLPMYLLAGSCRLRTAEVRRLVPGDTLLMEDLASRWPSAWLIIAHKRRVALHLEQRRAIIAGPLEPYMSEQIDQRIDDGSVDDLEIDIKFELGRAQMPLRQLQHLADGSVIPLERDFTSPVDVVIGGKRVGEGEIVDIDGRIGVRLTRFQSQ